MFCKIGIHKYVCLTRQRERQRQRQTENNISVQSQSSRDITGRTVAVNTFSCSHQMVDNGVCIVVFYVSLLALNGLFCADVPLRNYSLFVSA